MSKHSTPQFILQRLLAAIPSAIGVIIVSFIMTRMLPGDPAAFFAGASATPEAIAQVQETLGLNKSWIEQFFIYIGELIRGNLGVSLTTGQTVIYDLVTRLPASLELTLAGVLFAFIIAVPLGILAALKPNSWLDHLSRFITTAGVSLPTFFTGLLLVYIFYFLLGIVPAPVGRLDLLSSPPKHFTGFYLLDSLIRGDFNLFVIAFQHLILPAITLGIFALAPLARITRASMITILGSDFIRLAKSNGLSPEKILFTYAFRNALLPIITTMGVVFSFLLGANILVEKVFAWPGIGSYAVEALINSDYAPVQGFVLTMAFLYIFLNLAIDILYGIIDPRAGF